MAAIVASLALRARALTRSGALAAFAIGTIVFGSLGWAGAGVLFAFFGPSIVLSRIGKARKRELVDIGKLDARDARQVLANGGVAALCALAALVFGKPANAAFAGAFAAAAADTWGTEIGTLAKQRARSILTLRPIATGLSGGVTLAGTFAEIAGGLVVALVAFAVGITAIVPVAIGGACGAFADSFLGASVQVLRYCPRCERRCETDPHVCGARTTIERGVPWMNNDAVNFAATLCGAVVAASLASYLPYVFSR
ncbi:MAG TPA: DUF92 domain-containing protein [Candidatus Baltobacteraceae bacterium]